MKLRDYLYSCVILLSVVSISLQDDPCDSRRPFPDFRQRLTSNKVAADTCLQDTYLDEGWYGEPGVEIPTDPPEYSQCGTDYPAYIHHFVNNTDLSPQGNYEDAIIYATLKSGSINMVTIQTKLCGAGKKSYRIYNLKRLPATCSSYCVAPAHATGATPSYTAPVKVTADLTKNKLVFNCNFKQLNDVLWYEVTWYINGLPIYTTELVETSPDLMSQTALHEQQIKKSGTEKVGFQVKCSFRASFRRESSLGLPSRSDNKFIGIKIITPIVTLDAGKSTKIKVKATAPIGWDRQSDHLDVNVVNFDTEKCIPLTQLSKCRTEVDPKKWHSNAALEIKAGESNLYGNDVTTRIIGLKTTAYFAHSIWGNATIGEIRVKISQNTRRIENKECYAVVDPHMKTFTGVTYDHMLKGAVHTFTMFRNKNLQQEIQFITDNCNGQATCICGLAIRAGRQVYEINHCGSRRRWDIGYKLCDDVEGIFEVGVIGSSYEITFSSKTKVRIDFNAVYGNFLNVYIYPSNLDFGVSDGLCGTLKNVNGVFKLRNGAVLHDYHAKFSESWRVPSGEIDLFNTAQIQDLKPASYHVYPCNCPDNPTEKSSLTCTDGNTEPADCAKVTKFRKSRTCKLGSRTKRHAVDAVDQFSQNRKPHRHLQKREAPVGWRNEWTEEKARAYCLQLFNRSKAVQLCADVPNVDQTGPLQNCIADIKFMGDTRFSSVAVESIKNKCYHEIESNTTLHNSTSETPSIFHQIQEVACINECSDHGNCTNGTCNCEEYYGGIDCSVDIRDAPIVDSVFNDGYCTQKDNCKEISVYGQTFLDTGSTHCKVRVEEVNEYNGSIECSLELYELYIFVKTGVIHDAGEYNHKAHVESISEAMCTLPKSRKKKSTVLVPEESSAKVYHISVTNDGNSYSNESVVVVFNSVCQYCKIDGVTVNCSIVDGYCVSGSRCFGNGEPLLNNDCYTCSVNGTSSAWIYSEAYRCQDPTTTHHVPVSSTNANPTTTHVPENSTNTVSESRPLWIIGVVLGGVALISLLGFGLIYKSKRKNLVAASTVDLKKKDDTPPPPPYTKE